MGSGQHRRNCKSEAKSQQTSDPGQDFPPKAAASLGLRSPLSSPGQGDTARHPVALPTAGSARWTSGARLPSLRASPLRS